MSWGNCTSGVHQYVKHVNLDLLGWTVYCSPDLKIEASSAGARLPSKWQWFLHHIWWACKRGQANGKVCWLCRLPTWLVFFAWQAARVYPCLPGRALHQHKKCGDLGTEYRMSWCWSEIRNWWLLWLLRDWVVFSLQCFNLRLSSLAPLPAFMPLDVKQVGVEMVVDSGPWEMWGWEVVWSRQFRRRWGFLNSSSVRRRKQVDWNLIDWNGLQWRFCRPAFLQVHAPPWILMKYQGNFEITPEHERNLSTNVSQTWFCIIAIEVR